MRSDDRPKDDVSPPAAYGNRDDARRAEADRKRDEEAQALRAERERGRTFSGASATVATEQQRQRAIDAAAPPTDAEIARFVFLRDKPNRTDVEEVEFDALDARIVDKPPVLEPLTPAEIGRLAEQRADPAQQPDPDLVAREGVPIPPAEREPPDAAKAGPALILAFDHMVAIVAGLVAVVPSAHNLAARVQAMRDAYDLAVYHAGPPPQK